MTVTIDGDETVTLNLKPIDDAVVTEVLVPNDFEYAIRGWVPCSGTFCSDTDALNVKLHYFPPGAFFSTVVRNKSQPWPIVFRR